MTTTGFYVSKLQYSGPAVDSSSIEFLPGLNVVYGASNTGKSFLVETIDYMLGGKGPLTDIPETTNLDTIDMVLTAFDQSYEIHLRRSMAGGPFLLIPPSGSPDSDEPAREPKQLSETHNAKRDENLSSFLLQKLNLDGKLVRKNARNDVVSLSFRNIARLCIVNEEEIIQKRSPLSDGNYTADTANTSDAWLLAWQSKTNTTTKAAPGWKRPRRMASRCAVVWARNRAVGLKPIATVTRRPCWCPTVWGGAGALLPAEEACAHLVGGAITDLALAATGVLAQLVSAAPRHCDFV
jgi:hypothetical protein